MSSRNINTNSAKSSVIDDEPDVAANLEGLMTDAEIQEALPLLRTDAWTAMSHPGEHDLDDDATLLTGIQDGYHDLLVGPCDPGVEEKPSARWCLRSKSIRGIRCRLPEASQATASR